jgi:hypothetical protein
MVEKLHSVWQDAGYALRQMRRAPSFAVVATTGHASGSDGDAEGRVILCGRLSTPTTIWVVDVPNHEPLEPLNP